MCVQNIFATVLKLPREERIVLEVAKMETEQDRETTFPPTSSSKDHLNAEKLPQNNFGTLAEDTRDPERQAILFKMR